MRVRINDRLLAECLGRTFGYDALRRLCDEVGGRISGTEAGRMAEEWALEAFRQAGLTPWTEEIRLVVWERGGLDAEVMGRGGWRLHALAHGFSPARCDLAAPVLDASYGLPEDYDRLGDAVAGSLALCREGAPEGQRRPHRTEKLAWALERGAAGLILGDSAPGCLPRTGVCHREGSPIPSLGISKEDADRLRRHLETGVRPVVRIRMENRLRPGSARNVLADLPGRSQDGEVVLAGAHLDSWDVSQGATDNGLGCAIVLHAARALASLGKQPRRTIRFALWTAEETGLHGSRAHMTSRLKELERIVAVMNFDMTGDPHGFWLPGSSDAPAALRELATALAPIGMRAEFPSGVSLHSDHQPFMLHGVPVVGLAATLPQDGGGAYYHSAGDTFEKVSLPALCRAAAVAAHALWLLADGPERLIPHRTRAEVEAMLEKANLSASLIDEAIREDPPEPPITP